MQDTIHQLIVDAHNKASNVNTNTNASNQEIPDKTPLEHEKIDEPVISKHEKCPNFPTMDEDFASLCKKFHLCEDLTEEEIAESKTRYDKYYRTDARWKMSKIPYDVEKQKSEYRPPYLRVFQTLMVHYFIDVAKKHNAEEKKWRDSWHESTGLPNISTYGPSGNRNSDIRYKQSSPIELREHVIKTSETVFSKEHTITCNEINDLPGYTPWDGKGPMPPIHRDTKTGKILENQWDVRKMAWKIKNLTTTTWRSLMHAGCFFQQFRNEVSDRHDHFPALDFWNEHIRDRTLRARFQYISRNNDWYITSLMPPMPIQGDVEHEFNCITHFGKLEEWATLVNDSQAPNMRINNDCVAFLTENNVIIEEFKNLPRSTVFYCKVEYVPVNNLRIGEFFVSNVAVYVRTTKTLKWCKATNDERIDVPTWNRGGPALTKVQNAIGKWQINERLRINQKEDEYQAEDQAVRERFHALLRRDGVNPEEN